MAEVKLLKIDPASGIDTEHDSMNDDVKFRHIEAAGNLTGHGRVSVLNSSSEEVFAVEQTGAVRSSGTVVAAPATLSGELVTKGQVDAAISSLVNGSRAKDPVMFTINGSVTSGVSFMEDLCSGIDEGGHTYAEGDYVLNLLDSKIYKVGALDTGKHRLTITTVADGDRYEVAEPGDTRWVRYDLVDSPSSREDQALYSFNGTAYKKIASVNFALATGIDLSAAFTTSASDSAIPIPGDSVETALKKCFGKSLDNMAKLADSASVATRGGNIVGFVTAVAGNWQGAPLTIAQAIDELAARLKVEEDWGHVANLQDAYVGGSVIDISAAEGHLEFKSTSADGKVVINTLTDVKKVMSFEVAPKFLDAAGKAVSVLTDVLAADRSYSLPEVGANAKFVMTEGEQTINGKKNFSNINLNAQFMINNAAVSAEVTAANMNTLVAGDSSNADHLHTHGGNSIELTADSAILTNHLVRISGNDRMRSAMADALQNAEVIGCYQGANLANNELGLVSLPGGRITGILAGAIANTPYFLSPSEPGKLVTTPPTGPGAIVVRVGKALNATDLLFVIDQPKRRAN